MNPFTSNFFPHARRAVIASATAVLLGAVPAFAQSGSAGSSYDSGKKNPTAPVAADVDSTKEINAQNTSAASVTAGRDKLAWGDRRFVTKAAEAGTDEVQVAQLAVQRATNAEIRSFAQKLASDHEQVNSELTQLASQKNVKLESEADRDRAYKRLAKKSGSEFDQEFVEHMIDEHEKTIKLFEKASTEAKDPEIRSFASKHVAHLRDHLQQAQGLQQTVRATVRLDDYSGRSTPASRASTDSSTSDTSTPSSSATAGATGSSTDRSVTPKRDGSR